MSISTQRFNISNTAIFNSKTSQPEFTQTKVALNYDPYAVLNAGRIGAANNTKTVGQINQQQLQTGIDDTRKYAGALLQRTGLIYHGMYLAGQEKYPPINYEAVDTIQSIFAHADDIEKDMARYTPEKLAQAWNRMNGLVVLLRKQELESK